MDTISKPAGTQPAFAEQILASHKPLSIAQRYDRFIENMKFSHFAVISMAILIGSCLGAIAAMFVFYNGGPMWAFGVGLAASMANLVACIGQAPTKWVINLFLLSVIVNVALLALFPII